MCFVTFVTFINDKECHSEVTLSSNPPGKPCVNLTSSHWSEFNHLEVMITESITWGVFVCLT